MRVALICHQNTINFEVRDALLRIPNTQVTLFFLIDKRLFDINGASVTAHDVLEMSDTYILDTHIPYNVKENIYHYFTTFGLTHLYGSTDNQKKAPHTFLIPKSLDIHPDHNDIEKLLVTLWTTITHPVRIKRKEHLSPNISSIHELRRHTLTPLLQGEHMECVYQPKGRKLMCTLVRHARGKKVYTTPLFEKITHTFGDRIASFSLPHIDKEKIIQKLEELFAYHPSLPTLHVELTYTPKGIYIMHAAPIQGVLKERFPETLHAVGMQPSELLASCIRFLSTK